jgi:hypothetical protein
MSQFLPWKPYILLRLPADLRERLRLAARDNQRSMTAEVVYRLQQSIRADDRRDRRRKGE